MSEDEVFQKHKEDAAKAMAKASRFEQRLPVPVAKPIEKEKPVEPEAPQAAAKAEQAKDLSAKAEAKPAEKTEAEKKEEAKAKELAEKKREIVEERIYTVPLVKAYKKPENKRAGYAVRLLRQFVSRHMKANESAVFIAPQANESINARGSRRPPKLLKIKASRDKEGKVLAELAA